MKTLVIASLLVVGSGFGLSSYLNQTQPVDRTIPAAREGIVVVRVPDGKIAVEGWDRAEVHVAGALADGDDALELTGSRGHVELRIVPQADSDAQATRLTIRVPVRSSLDIETVDAEVSVHGVDGVLRLASLTGDMTITGRPTGIVARSERGDIDVTAEGSPGFAYSEEGTVTLRGSTADRMRTEDYGEFCDHARGDARGDARHRQDCEHFDRHWGTSYWRDLGSSVGSIVSQALGAVDLEGNVDYREHAGGFHFDLSGTVDIDFEQLEVMFDDLEVYFEDLGEQLGQGMEHLGEELGASMEAVGAELEAAGEELRRSAHRRHRKR